LPDPIRPSTLIGAAILVAACTGVEPTRLISAGTGVWTRILINRALVRSRALIETPTLLEAATLISPAILITAWTLIGTHALFVAPLAA